MPWFRVDDGLSDHPKVLAAGNAAMGLWVRAGAWSMKHLTDGFVPVQVAALLGSQREVKALMASGLWLPADGGYMFHAWEGRQPTREAVLKEREAATERQKRAREKSRESRRDIPVTNGVDSVPPSRPVPTQTDMANPRQASYEGDGADSADDPTVIAAQVLGIKNLRRIRDAFGDLLDVDASDGEVLDAAAAVLGRSRTFVNSPEAYIEKAVKESRHEVSVYAAEAQARSPRRLIGSTP